MAQLHLDSDEPCGRTQLLCHAMLGEMQQCSCLLVSVKNYSRRAVHTNVMARQLVHEVKTGMDKMMDEMTHKIMAIVSVANKGAVHSMGNNLCAVAAC